MQCTLGNTKALVFELTGALHYSWIQAKFLSVYMICAMREKCLMIFCLPMSIHCTEEIFYFTDSHLKDEVE